MQLLLLGKAVVVALMGEEVVFPGQRTGQSGLLAMYLAICYSIVGIAVQYYTADTLISGIYIAIAADAVVSFAVGTLVAHFHVAVALLTTRPIVANARNSSMQRTN